VSLYRADATGSFLAGFFFSCFVEDLADLEDRKLNDLTNFSEKCSVVGLGGEVAGVRVFPSDSEGDDRGTLIWLVLDSLFLPPSSIEPSDAAFGRGASRRLAILNFEDRVSVLS